jgi:hypothetical protein
MKKKNGKNQVASTKSMEDDLIKEIQNSRRFKRRASAKAANPKKPNKTKRSLSPREYLVNRAKTNEAKPKKPKSNVSPREHLVNRAKTTEAMREDVNISLDRDAKPVPEKKPKYRNDKGRPAGTESKKSTKTYTPRKKYESGIDSYETPFGTIKADSSDDAFNFDVEEKDGGYLKRDMMMKKRKKGGVVKRRMGGKVRGYGKALRGY